MKTSSLTTKDIVQKWYLIDCSGKKLGRLSVQIANILRGKNKPEYTPNSDVGDFVVLINAERVEISGNKSKDKIYFKHTGYPGNLKEINFQDLLNKDPEKVLRNAVKGMLPKNRLNRKIINKLKVYSGENHPHEAQNPEVIN
ncbi:50S ribosomal protein L13 [SAR86 cluster bacterium]|jgi:large subunit ribosomal protein L13|nr:50S ribosomal protein L13 [bacterium]MEC7809295.1 50S ribosomal protein L13 [Pseudomonadota bacterium]URQ64537.1 50S ribosomal protein L13 [SAR86 cluster bacterium]|tara:strand:+ start:542 stop:967 length:426 start_codon:yes stop_codon:yes gene_type:complete